MLRILHLSDLHFGNLLDFQQTAKQKCAHRFWDGKGESAPLTLAGILERDSLLKDRPDVVVVTGDVGWSGAEEDYVHALAFLERLRTTWPETSFVVVPGNHDVKRDAAPGSHQEAFFKFAEQFHGGAFGLCHPLFQRTNRASFVSVQEVHARTGVPEDRLLVVGVNSAASLEGGNTPVYVSPKMLEQVASLLESRDPREFRLFALHHHLLPFAESRAEGSTNEEDEVEWVDGTIVGNSAKLQTWLANHNFSLVLHGHKHKPHGRLDTLWRKSDPASGRTVLIAGAGSAGVYDHERGPEPLSYNVITARRFSSSRWSVDAVVQQISEEDISINAKHHYSYSAEVGSQETFESHVFHAQHMDVCHGSIQRRAAAGVLLRSFVSIVDVCEYKHPPTATLDDRPATPSEVVRSFAALHPEYDSSNKWRDSSKLESALREMPERYQFEHGPRLFGIPHGHPTSLMEDPAKRLLLRPILKALNQLNTASKAHAYVSLYRPDIDVLSSRTEPFPSLMSLQFLRGEGDTIDLVATFRKLELSFWWVVNMYEAIELLKWAVEAGSTQTGAKDQRRVGKITFFAALAEWKPRPEPSFIAELDSTDLGELTTISLSTANASGIDRLIKLLEEKKERTNAQNLDHGGLKRLAEVLGAVLESRTDESAVRLHKVCGHIASAAEHTRGAVAGHAADPNRIVAAKTSLDEALAGLREASRALNP